MIKCEKMMCFLKGYKAYMKIRIENNTDTLCIVDGNIEASVDKQKYIFDSKDIETVLLITSDLGPMYDDMCLAIRINAETAMFIMSSHPLFKSFLFDDLKTVVDIDYEEVINASLCVDNKVFVIYQRNKS